MVHTNLAAKNCDACAHSELCAIDEEVERHNPNQVTTIPRSQREKNQSQVSSNRRPKDSDSASRSMRKAAKGMSPGGSARRPITLVRSRRAYDAVRSNAAFSPLARLTASP